MATDGETITNSENTREYTWNHAGALLHHCAITFRNTDFKCTTILVLHPEADIECNTVLVLHPEADTECNTILVLHSEDVILNVIPFWYYVQKH